MTIRHLKTFIAVYEHGGITKAGEALHIAQPAVSQTIAELEKYYNVILFDRLNKRLILTDCGRQLLVKAKETVASFDDFERLANQSKLNTKIRIGSSLTIGKQLIPKILTQIKEDYPQIKVSVVIDSTAVIENLLTSGNLDFALVEGNILSGNLIKQVVAHDRLVAICGTAYPIPQSVSIQELADYPMMLRGHGSASREFFDGVIASNGLTINVEVESSSNQALISCAESNLGVTILPQKLVEDRMEKGTLKVVEIKGCNLERSYYLVYHKNKRFSPLQEKVLSVCKNIF